MVQDTIKQSIQIMNLTSSKYIDNQTCTGLNRPVYVPIS